MKIFLIVNIFFASSAAIYLILSGVKQQFGVHMAEIVAGIILLIYCIAIPVIEYKKSFKK